MCPFGDSDKTSQIQFAKKNDLSTEQWKIIFEKVSKYCIWSIVEGALLHNSLFLTHLANLF